VTQWNGGWLSVYTAHLGRTSQQSILKRERAFRLTGFKPIEKHLWCRPDNLLESADCTFSRLVNIGLERTAILMRVDHFNQDIAINPMDLWAPKQLNKTYNILSSLLEKSAKRLDELELKHAAKESFMIGEHVIRQINQDPLLPEQIVNASARSALVTKMAEYDSVCHPIWHKFVYNT
jgi:phenylacetic acid degradation operon negative regulatory protein